MTVYCICIVIFCTKEQHFWHPLKKLVYVVSDEVKWAEPLMNSMSSPSAVSTESERQAGPPHSMCLSDCINPLWEHSVGWGGFPPGCTHSLHIWALLMESMIFVMLRCIILIYSRCFFCTSLKQHAGRPRGSQHTHITPSWKWQVLKIWLCSWYLFFFPGWSSSCLVAMVFAHTETGSRRMKKEMNLSCWITTNSVKLDHLTAKCVTKSQFLLYLL